VRAKVIVVFLLKALRQDFRDAADKECTARLSSRGLRPGKIVGSFGGHQSSKAAAGMARCTTDARDRDVQATGLAG
jgi:hypothetical protein